MISRSSVLHLRLPFSYFLLPVYLLALLTVETIDGVKAAGIFMALHFLLYPAANGFNSFYDRDRESIGALPHPPPVTRDLWGLSLALNVAALGVAGWIGWPFALICLIYSLAALAYSWDQIRLKRYPVLGWLLAGGGQGTTMFLAVAAAAREDASLAPLAPPVALPALAAGLFVLGFIPLSQVYQHREDARRGDLTISRRLGIRGTFYVSAFFMANALALDYLYFQARWGTDAAWAFAGANAPAMLYFIHWFRAVRRDPSRADFSHAMRLCTVAASGLNAFALGALMWCA